MKITTEKHSELYDNQQDSNRIDFCISSQTFYFKRKELVLSNKLSKLFYQLYLNKNSLVTRDSLITLLWAQNRNNAGNNLTHQVCILRKKITEKFEQEVKIETIPKSGYILKIENTEPSAQQKHIKRLKQLGWQVNLPT